ncbi:GNAT family N-acetyltransferase [Labrys sp. KNU-23]|uniref:GNAT family N-acetyltransferase n=1 Tax=Labrys sp. KNU-23 TaxID=2789216 RepID=UPI0011EEBD0A|nr:GNAT family N-acetyltransferase [Labrys sp. KNU-23]QEN86118.1 GNAT family N-acetyltransferase [Labrys sp. KNU-23]
MTNAIRIRRFEPADRDRVLGVILPIQREEFGIEITAGDQPDLMRIDAFYQTGCGGFWVAEHEGAVIGTIGLKDIGLKDIGLGQAGRPQAALRKMFVATPYRGRPHGVASHLLDHLLAEARERGVGEIFLGTTAKFLAAHRFYEKNGFAEIARHDLPASFPVMAVDTKFYLRRLAD